MKFTRQRYQFGSFRRLKRKKGPDVWEFRYRDSSAPGRPLRQMTISTAECATEALARRRVEALLWKLNADTPQSVTKELTFGALIDLFVEEEHLQDISKLKAGEENTFGTLKVSTARSYLQIIEKHIRPQWGDCTLSNVRPAQVTKWFKEITLTPVTKTHIKAVMSRLFKKAMLWELMDLQVNPMSIVEIRGASKRAKQPTVLTVEQCQQVTDALREPYRTMFTVGVCTGLRVSEILALKWSDVDFEKQSLRVTRAVVRGVVDTVKTEYSQDELPLDSDFARHLKEWKSQCAPSPDNWVFPSPVTQRPFEPGTIQQKVFRVLGKKLGIGRLGWHALRHTYRSLLDAGGAPIGVQQKLMRHAQVSTTMNRYGNALMESKRQANSNVVRMVLKAQVSGPEQASVGLCGVEAPALANA